MQFYKLKQPSVKESISSSSVTSLATCATISQKKYRRIEPEIRNAFLDQVIFGQKKIKEAAQEFNINYSSAKTILHLNRKKIQKKFRSPKQLNCQGKRCTFKQCNKQSVEVIASQGGKNIITINVNSSKQVKPPVSLGHQSAFKPFQKSS